MTHDIDIAIRSLLIRRKGDWLAIAKDSGVSYSWLSKFVNGHIDNPGYATLKRLYVHLSPADADELPSEFPASEHGAL